MRTSKGKWVHFAVCPAILLPLTFNWGPAAAGPEAGEREWPGLHKEGKPFPSRNLNQTKARVDFFYHGPEDKKPHLEGCILKAGQDTVTVGVALWKPDAAFSAYDKERRALEVYLTPHHLKDPEEVRILILPMTEFTAPAAVRTVRVIYLP